MTSKKRGSNTLRMSSRVRKTLILDQAMHGQLVLWEKPAL
jgi:hypothetical protein